MYVDIYICTHVQVHMCTGSTIVSFIGFRSARADPLDTERARHCAREQQASVTTSEGKSACERAIFVSNEKD